jgi:hypothetical protein
MSGLRILITGSRDWSDRDAIRAAIVTWGRGVGARPQQVTVVHGGARGADLLAAAVAGELGCQVEEHPADWRLFGKAAGHRRNAEMVQAGADVVLAFPLGESRGTRMCMWMAKAAGIPVFAYDPAVPSLVLDDVDEPLIDG